MKLYVEMTEQEYEEYKKFKQQDVKKDIREFDIYELLALNGFLRPQPTTIQTDLMTGEDVHLSKFVKGKKKIMLEDRDI